MTAILPDVRRAVAYGRISEDDLDRRDGVDDQLRRAEAHVERRGWDLVDTFRDDDLSAYSGKPRPGYEALMAEVAAGRVDTIVVRHIDRLWRDDLEAATGRKFLRQHRVLLAEYGGMEYPLWTAHGQQMARTMGGNATFESDIKSERVREAAERRAQEGRMNGVCPFGWRRLHERTASGRVLSSREVVHEPEAEVVREITARLLRGDSLTGITADLNARQVPPPGAEFIFRHKRRAEGNADGALWGKTSVKKLALRESNAGLRVWHKGEPDERLVPGTWPALVEEADWRRVRALLTAEGRDKRKTRPGSRQHLLSWGLGYCSVCGGVLRVARKGRKGYEHHELYVCAEQNLLGTNRTTGEPAPKSCVGRRKEWVDSFLRDVVVARLSRPDALDWLATDDRELADATRRAQEARELLATAGAKLAMGEWAPETVDAVTAATRPKLDQAETEIRRLSATVDHAALAEIAGPQAAERWDALTVTGRRAVLEALGIRVELLPGRKGPGFDPSSVRITWAS
jgi:DNA invertase Pin-like site-specific DNA recombinase